MLDIHTHLYWKSYDIDRDAVVARARAAGVKKMICVGTEPKDNPQALAMAERYGDVYASVGLHPHFFNEIVEKNYQLPTTNYQLSVDEKNALEKIVQELKSVVRSSDKVVAIGECGLDYYSRDSEKLITEEQKTLQKEGFIAQLELAQELGLPLIIHTRPSAGSMDAYQDLLEILQTINYKLPAVLHCYQGDTEITKKFLEFSHVYFSFAGNITYPVKKALAGTKDDLTETVKLVPPERLFVETDCPFLAPQSRRGERNEPAFVMETADFLASVKRISSAELDKLVIKNAEKVFWKNC